MSASEIWAVVYAIVHVAVIIRALVAPNRDPASRTAWVVILVFIPAISIVAYFLIGEPWVASRFRRRADAVSPERESDARVGTRSAVEAVPEHFRPAFRTCEILCDGFTTIGNRARLAQGSNAAIDGMIEDFEQAQRSIHISFYIWLTDRNGRKVVEALQRAAARGVVCRVVADGIGSRGLIESRHWTAMREAGVKLCTSMKLSFGLAMILGNRIDLRNHRKIVVVDNRITWCGSQNCADPEFRVKPRYAPWVDIMLRFEGAVAVQNQRLFARDWITETGQDLSDLIAHAEPPVASDGFPAIAFGTGPTSPRNGMSNVFISLLHAAQHEVVISTPYFVPDTSLLAALVCCARRGVPTTLIVPARNDSWEVATISRAHYPTLIEAGVRVLEYRGGLLHAKTLVVDETAVLVGSANMDRRSLELNFENNILLCSSTVARDVRQRQDTWMADSREVARESVMHRSLPRRIGENIATMFGPVF